MTPVEQLALGWLWLSFELRSPVAESLEWNALRLAILPLIQVATLPRLMMRTPERLTRAIRGYQLRLRRLSPRPQFD